MTREHLIDDIVFALTKPHITRYNQKQHNDRVWIKTAAGDERTAVTVECVRIQIHAGCGAGYRLH